uniref:Uncharacterized protein n=1 Tax=Triticum urartu TaxID=4572 RepID=A0A8R7R6P8_TRIUA
MGLGLGTRWSIIVGISRHGREESKSEAAAKSDGVSVRSDGRWIEQEINIELDKPCLDGEERNVSIEFRGFTGSHSCQIIIEGIEIRPRAMES